MVGAPNRLAEHSFERAERNLIIDGIASSKTLLVIILR